MTDATPTPPPPPASPTPIDVPRGASPWRILLIAFVVANGTGADRLPYAFIGAVMAAAYLGSLAIIRVRD
jgi:hypothetical protein